jgi:hypothetical protein
MHNSVCNKTDQELTFSRPEKNSWLELNMISRNNSWKKQSVSFFSAPSTRQIVLLQQSKNTLNISCLEIAKRSVFELNLIVSLYCHQRNHTNEEIKWANKDFPGQL